jgi:hypothetical protein
MNISLLSRVVTAFVILVFAGSVLNAQTTTHLGVWTKTADPFAKKGYTETISTSAPLAGIAGARVTLSATCRRVDSSGNIIFPSAIDYRVAVVNATVDIQTRTIAHPNLDNTDYEQRSSVPLKVKYGTSDSEDLNAMPVNSHSFSFFTTLTAVPSGQKVEMLDGLLGFSVNGHDVALSYSGSQRTFADFASNCDQPTAEQVAFAKKINDENERHARAAKADSFWNYKSVVDIKEWGIYLTKSDNGQDVTFREAQTYCEEMPSFPGREGQWDLPHPGLGYRGDGSRNPSAFIGDLSVALSPDLSKPCNISRSFQLTGCRYWAYDNLRKRPVIIDFQTYERLEDGELPPHSKESGLPPDPKARVLCVAHF